MVTTAIPGCRPHEVRPARGNTTCGWLPSGFYADSPIRFTDWISVAAGKAILRDDSTKVRKANGLAPKIGPQSMEGYGGSELGAPVYDSGDVFEIVAGQEVSMSAIGECFQFRRDEHGSADQPNRGSAGEDVGDGRTNGFVIPAVPETQDCLISRHHVEQGATSQPPAYGC